MPTSDEHKRLGFIHDLVNHMTAATLSMNHMEEQLAKNSLLLRTYAVESARTRKSIEKFARSAQQYMKKSNVYAFLNIQKEIDQVLDVCVSEIKRLDIDIETRIDPRLTLCGNRFLFRQIISNLISNAIHAIEMCAGTADRKRTRRLIRIIGTSTEHGLQLDISDTGCGITKDHTDRIFEPFFTTKNERGTGIGLASIKEIVEKDFRGSIRLAHTKTADTGTTFSVTLRNNLNAPSSVHLAREKRFRNERAV